MIEALKRGAGRRLALAASIATLVSGAGSLPPASGQGISKEVKEGSRNLDVPFEGSHAGVLEAMFQMARPTNEDFVIDLGSGDGRIVIAAARRFGARGFGVDLNAELVRIANQRARQQGVGDRVRFFVRDIFNTDISRASVVTMFLYPEVVLKLKSKLLNTLAPGSRVVSNEYHLGAWRPDAARIVTNPRGKEGVVYMWVVPARIAGWWSWEISYPPYFDRTLRYQARFRQIFQDMAGEVELGLQPMRIHDAVIAGARVVFSATGEVDHQIVRHDFTGKVMGNEIEGTVRLGMGVRAVTLPWQAWRARKVVP